MTLPLSFDFQKQIPCKSRSNSGFWLWGPTNQPGRNTGLPHWVKHSPTQASWKRRDTHISVNEAPRNKNCENQTLEPKSHNIIIFHHTLPLIKLNLSIFQFTLNTTSFSLLHLICFGSIFPFSIVNILVISSRSLFRFSID